MCRPSPDVPVVQWNMPYLKFKDRPGAEIVEDRPSTEFRDMLGDSYVYHSTNAYGGREWIRRPVERKHRITGCSKPNSTEQMSHESSERELAANLFESFRRFRWMPDSEQKLTATHDSTAAWAGIGISVVLTDGLPAINMSGYNGTTNLDLDNYVCVSLYYFPYISGSTNIGLTGGTLYDISKTNAAIGTITVSATWYSPMPSSDFPRDLLEPGGLLSLADLQAAIFLPVAVTLHDLENAVSDLGASMFWTMGHIPPTHQVEPIRQNGIQQGEYGLSEVQNSLVLLPGETATATEQSIRIRVKDDC
ncbi:hypothetical protein B0H10DRAFT_1962074 [Mycena sp. CBHHK59/15]|nr:hypothetical protein B0H10DRAFT_1962074 [Mycena sp. CBHHK59/15]